MRGVVKEFRAEAGFGTLLLEDGSELPFDVAACTTRHVRPGASCEVTVGRGLRGPKATLVRFPRQADRTASLAELLARAKRHGILSAWSPKDAAEAARALGLDEAAVNEAGAAALLERHYGRWASERATRDRVLVLDWRTVDDAVAMMCRVAGIEDLTVAARHGRETVVLRDGEHEESVDLTGTLQPLAEFLDDALARRGRAERWISLGGGELEIFALRSGEISLFD